MIFGGPVAIIRGSSLHTGGHVRRTAHPTQHAALGRSRLGGSTGHRHRRTAPSPCLPLPNRNSKHPSDDGKLHANKPSTPIIHPLEEGLELKGSADEPQQPEDESAEDSAEASASEAPKQGALEWIWSRMPWYALREPAEVSARASGHGGADAPAEDAAVNLEAAAVAAAKVDASATNAFTTWQDVPAAKGGDGKGAPEDTPVPVPPSGDVFATSDQQAAAAPSEDSPNANMPAPTPPSPLVLRLVAIIKAIWLSPVMEQVRMTLSVANVLRTAMRLPAMLAVVVTQLALITSQAGLGIGLLAPGVTAGIPAMLSGLPMLAPIILGAGLFLNSISNNANYILPRILVSGMVLWTAWFGNTLVHQVTNHLCVVEGSKTVCRLRGIITTASELSFAALAVLGIMSTFGVKVSTAILPLAAIGAFASKDVLLNANAGFFLLLAQPFHRGDTVAISHSHSQNWFEGKVVSVDMRYTTIRSGKRRMMVPNRTFLNREFIVHDDGEDDNNEKNQQQIV